MRFQEREWMTLENLNEYQHTKKERCAAKWGIFFSYVFGNCVRTLIKKILFRHIIIIGHNQPEHSISLLLNLKSYILRATIDAIQKFERCFFVFISSPALLCSYWLSAHELNRAVSFANGVRNNSKIEIFILMIQKKETKKLKPFKPTPEIAVMKINEQQTLKTPKYIEITQSFTSGE